MSTILSFHVPGLPKGQPRARACIRGKHAGVYDPGTADSWKHAVADTWRTLPPREPLTGAVSLTLEFALPRPKNHYRTSGALKDSAPMLHIGKPDCDNLAKAVCDVLTRLGAWKDDALVWSMNVRRRWASDLRPSGCQIIIEDSTSI